MINIKDIQGNVIYSTEINKGAKRKLTLMKEDNVTLPFSLDEPLSFPIGSYADIEGKRYEVTDLQKPTLNASTGGYDYQLRLDAYYWKWKNKIFKFTPEVGGQEASWSLTASLDVQMDIFLKNMKALGYKYGEIEFEVSIDATVENKAISMTYENMNMIDALSAMAESWECEWWVVDNIIHFGRCEYGTAVDFEIGVNVAEMSSSSSQSKFATRLYVFGSTRNLPANYRKADESIVVNGVVQRRLMLPEGIPYIDANEGLSNEEAIEEVVVLDDIYPKTDGNISAVETYEDSVENEDGTISTETFYRFKDDGITFSKDYILEGEELRVQFTGGSLNGMEFGLVFNPNGFSEKNEDGSWNSEAQLFEIVACKDYGRKLPDETLYPKVGDTYVLIGWDSTKISDLGLVEKAEEDLYAKGLEISKKRKIDPNTYSCKMMSDYMYGLDEEGNQNEEYAKHFEVGDKVKLINQTYFEDGRESRIIGYEYNLDFPYDNPVFIVGETSSYSRLGALESKVESLTLKGQTYTGGSGMGVYVIGTNDTTRPTNRNVYSALKSDSRFLRKDEDDETLHNLGVGKNLIVGGRLSSKDFVQGKNTGAGWASYRDPNGNAVFETDKIIARQSLDVNEIIVNQETFNRGSITYVKGGCTITKVEEHEDFYRCYYDNEEGKRYSGFREDDQAKCQRYDDTYANIIKYYWRLVVGVGSNYVDLSKTDCDGTGIPEEGDDITQLGNRTDKERQSAIVVSPDDGGKVMILAGINEFNLSEKNMVGMGVNPNTGRAYIYGYGDMYFGDRNLNKNYITFQTKNGETEPTLTINADVVLGENSEGLSNLSEFKDVQNNLEAIKAQTDMEYTIWFFDEVPTLDNEPAVKWTTDELKALHDQDLYFSDVLGRAWRWKEKDGVYVWDEITDERTLAALREASDAKKLAESANTKVTDMEYLKTAFGKDERVLEGGIVMSKIVSVTNTETEVEAFLNGSDFGKDETHGKLLLAGGIPSEGENLEARAKNAATKMYEDGTFYSQKGEFDDAVVNGAITLKGMYRHVVSSIDASESQSLSDSSGFTLSGVYVAPLLSSSKFTEILGLWCGSESSSVVSCTIHFSEMTEVLIYNGEMHYGVSSLNITHSGGFIKLNMLGYNYADWGGQVWAIELSSTTDVTVNII